MESKPLPDETYTASETVNVCVTCSNEFVGKFCNRCGEKVISQHERSIMHFLEGTFHMFTHVDGKIFKNLKWILIRPGYVSKNFAIGRRQPFMKPIAMFFVANLIYFVLPVFQTFTTTLNSQRYSHPYSSLIEDRIETKMKQKGMTFEELSEVYNTKTTGHSKLLLILVVPMYAVVFALANINKKKLFADHLLISLEFMCYILFYCTIFLSFVLAAFISLSQLLGANLNQFFSNEGNFLVPFIACAIIYFIYRAERIFYEEKIVWAGMKAAAFVFLTMWVIYVYRFILFHITISLI
jgi:hypothetical protein